MSGSATDQRERALVLGGGGSTGNAWLIGVLAGLLESGLDVTSPDVTIGTSAGSTAAAQLAGSSPSELYTAILDAPAPPTRRQAGQAAEQIARRRAIVAAAEDAADMRRRLCAAALEAEAASDGSWTARWRGIVAQRLAGQDWPDRHLLITAVNARTAGPVVFDWHSGVDLADAVAASTSSGLPYRIADVPYLDGGFRTNAENADLAAGYARVLVLAPFGGTSWAPEAWGLHLAAQIAELRAGGSRVETISPDADAEHLFGAHAMDVSLRPAAARAGHAQGVAAAGKVAELWS